MAEISEIYESAGYGGGKGYGYYYGGGKEEAVPRRPPLPNPFHFELTCGQPDSPCNELDFQPIHLKIGDPISFIIEALRRYALPMSLLEKDPKFGLCGLDGSIIITDILAEPIQFYEDTDFDEIYLFAKLSIPVVAEGCYRLCLHVNYPNIFTRTVILCSNPVYIEEHPCHTSLIRFTNNFQDALGYPYSEYGGPGAFQQIYRLPSILDRPEHKVERRVTRRSSGALQTLTVRMERVFQFETGYVDNEFHDLVAIAMHHGEFEVWYIENDDYLPFKPDSEYKIGWRSDHPRYNLAKGSVELVEADYYRTKDYC